VYLFSKWYQPQSAPAASQTSSHSHKPRKKVEAQPKQERTRRSMMLMRSHERLFHPGEVQQQALRWLTGTACNLPQMIKTPVRTGRYATKMIIPVLGRLVGDRTFIPVPPGRYYKKVRVAPWISGDARPNYIRDWYQKGVPATVGCLQPEGAAQTW